jgi:hypothetical protein
MLIATIEQYLCHERKTILTIIPLECNKIKQFITTLKTRYILGHLFFNLIIC